MSSGPPSYIRYFAQTDEGPLGRIAVEYLKSMLRIAPVRLVSVSGGLSGVWHRFENLLMTPMAGTCVNAVCVYPEKWVWMTSVPMTNANEDEDGLPDAPRYVKAPESEPRGLDIMMPEMQPTTEVAERVDELYTPKYRNVLFMGVPPATDQQRTAAAKYEDVIVPTLLIANTVAQRWPERSFDAGIVPVPVTAHARIREAIVGHP